MKIGVAARGGMGNLVLMSPFLRALEIMGHEVELLFDGNDPRTRLLEQISWLPIRSQDLSTTEAEQYQLVIAFMHPGKLSGVFSLTVREAHNVLLVPLVRWTEEPQHEIDYFMRPARMLGWTGPPPAPFLPTKKPDHDLPPHVGFAIGFMPEKEWYKKSYAWQRWRDLALALAPHSIVLYGGGETDHTVAQWIKEGSTNVIGEVMDAPISEVAWLLHQYCRVLVANDTGMMHVASTVGTPVVALFGPTSLRKNAPHGPGPIRIISTPAGCAPCYGQEERWSQCMGGCMNTLDTGKVLAAIHALM